MGCNELEETQTAIDPVTILPDPLPSFAFAGGPENGTRAGFADPNDPTVGGFFVSTWQP
jgi:hypothetical protein